VRAPLVAGRAISLADPSGPIEAAKESMATVRSATNPSSRELNRQGVTAEVRDAHARYYRDLATAAAVGLRSMDLAAWLDRLNIEHANLRAALDWSLASGADETAAGIAAALYPF
jgi:hypothetical protein